MRACQFTLGNTPGHWFAALWLATTCPATATSSGVLEHEACMAQSNGVTSAMLDCLVEVNDRTDAELSGALDALTRTLAGAQVDALLKSQDDWERFRQSTCEFEARLSSEGSFASVAFADCWLAITRQRLVWSKSLVRE
jgi:uncharacterized protein YecT (DUF1311 family)